MTGDEKRQQKALPLLEYQEIEEDLAHLREKAGRLAAPIDDISTWLRHVHIVHPSEKENDQKRDAKIRANISQYSEALNFQPLLSLMDETQQAERKLQEYSARKTSLGLK